MRGKVLMIYTGGTIGMLPKEPGNPGSPLAPAGWERLKQWVPSLSDLDLDVDLHEMRLIDSSDMEPDYWVEIASAISERYEEYSGFVILHGTDTMAYTATALSFLLENLDKPVILTGAQIPIGRPRSDALQNLVTSLMLACPERFNLPVVPEVTIFFHNVLLRGNRTRKISSTAYGGFHSPNYGILGTAGEKIQINRKLVRYSSNKGFFINESLEKNVFAFDIFPGLKVDILKKLFDLPKLKGVVLKTYGAGNAPSDPEFIRMIDYGINRKKLALVNVSQCAEGMVDMGLYDTGAQLLRLGVISGVDMTPEAALVKMQFLLGQGFDLDTIKKLMQTDLRGEQSANVFQFFYGRGTADPLFEGPADQLPSGFDVNAIVSASIRLDSVSFRNPSGSEPVKLAFFVNYPKARDALHLSELECKTLPRCVGLKERFTAKQPVHIILNCTEALRRVLSPGRPLQLRIVSLSREQVSWKGISIMIHTGVD